MDPNDSWPHFSLGRAYVQKSRFEEAIAELQNSMTISGGEPAPMAALGHANAVSGRRQQAQEVLAKLQERSKQNYVSAYEIATVYAGLGNKDRAFEWLEKAYWERSSMLVHINWDPRFIGLQSDARFQELTKRIGFPSSAKTLSRASIPTSRIAPLS